MCEKQEELSFPSRAGECYFTINLVTLLINTWSVLIKSEGNGHIDSEPDL